MQMVSPSLETRDFASARRRGVLQAGDVRSTSLPIWQARSHPGKIKADRGDLGCLLHFSDLLHRFVKAWCC